MSAVEQIFPLVPRRPLLGVSYAAMRSARRGVGTDIAGSRPYRPGDNVDKIDWAASARLSSATGLDEFIVRERFAEEAPWVVVLADRRPSMALYAEPFPWLRKFEALEQAVDIVLRSALAARSLPAYVDSPTARCTGARRARSATSGRGTSSVVHRRGGHARAGPRGADHPPAAAAARHLRLRALRLPRTAAAESWLEAIERGWDVIPVVIQDPTWEQSFPDVSGIAIPFADVNAGETGRARLSRREAAVRREANEARHGGLLEQFEQLGLEPVLLERSDAAGVHATFIDWAERRLTERGRRW